MVLLKLITYIPVDSKSAELDLQCFLQKLYIVIGTVRLLGRFRHILVI